MDSFPVGLIAGVAGTVALATLIMIRKSSQKLPVMQPDSASNRASAEYIIDQMAEGVVLLNPSLTPSIANPAARRLLHLPPSELPPSLPSDELASMARRSAVEGKLVDNVVRWETGQSFHVRVVPLDESIGTVLFIRDVTDELETQLIRRQFVANASHELKTPVASLQALAEAIQTALPDDLSSAERFAGRMVVESERMSRLIQGLLDLSRVEDPISFSSNTVDLSEIAHQEWQRISEWAISKTLVTRLDVAPGIRVAGDGDQLGLMIRNLLDNALRYTPEQGTVRLRVSRENAVASVEVADTGPGIAMQSQARVFERFFRADPDRSRARGGTGLGLSIVRHVAEQHGGHVSLASQLGEGSFFTVRLPALDDDGGPSGRQEDE